MSQQGEQLGENKTIQSESMGLVELTEEDLGGVIGGDLGGLINSVNHGVLGHLFEGISKAVFAQRPGQTFLLPGTLPPP